MHPIGCSEKPQVAGNLIEQNFINDSLLRGGQGEREEKAQGLYGFCSGFDFALKHFQGLAWGRHALSSVSTLVRPSPGLRSASEEGSIEMSPSSSPNHDRAETG